MEACRNLRGRFEELGYQNPILTESCTFLRVTKTHRGAGDDAAACGKVGEVRISAGA
jgi:hypothetical protein